MKYRYEYEISKVSLRGRGGSLEDRTDSKNWRLAGEAKPYVLKL